MAERAETGGGEANGWEAAARVHQELFTGLILRVALRHGAKACEDFVFRTFRAQHDDKFRAALETLGLSDKPLPQACAEFFYLANKVGGVDVECMVESPTKAWIRYPPPRWAYMGASICGVPNEASIGMMRGFHSRCGETLGEPRLGFVCTKMTTNGDPGLEGYFELHDRPLAPEERLRFAPGEHGPAFAPAAAPPIEWSADRLRKARRNYAISYIRRMLPALRGALGPTAAAETGAEAARRVGLQMFKEMAALQGGVAPGRAGFGGFLTKMLQACGDAADRDGHDALVQSGWRMMEGAEDATEADFQVWAALWAGAAQAHDPRLELTVDRLSPSGAVDRARRLWRLSRV